MKRKGLRYSVAIIWIFVAAAFIRTPIKSPALITFPDDPQARFEFELLRTKDPATGKVPTNIRKLELEFASQTQSGNNIPLAASDISTAWANRGLANVGGRTRALAVDADDENIILAGGVSGGMWRSIDQGDSWVKTTGSNELQSVSCIAQDLFSMNNDTWYYETGEFSGNTAGGEGAFYLGDGIYKSEDNGATWTLLPATESSTPQSTNAFDINHEIVVNPLNGDIIVANLGGIYYSNNGGTIFTEELDNGSGWCDVGMSSTGVAFAVLEIPVLQTEEMETAAIWKSSNGTTWTNISSGGPTLLSGDRKELSVTLNGSGEEIFYLLGENSSETVIIAFNGKDYNWDKWAENGDN